MPQIDPSTFATQIFWLIVAFVTLYWLLSRRALPRLTEVLEARQDRIAADLDEAERLRREAEAALTSYQAAIAKAQDEAHALLAETQGRLQAEAARRQAELEAQLAGQLSAAEARIAEARQQRAQGARGGGGDGRPGRGRAPGRRQGRQEDRPVRAQGRARGARVMAHVLLELLALVILFAIIYKPVSKVILGGLDGHAAKVRAELDAAKRLREEAQSLLSGYQRQLASGEDQARAIVEHARAETERQVERHRAELEASLRRRTEQAMGRIAQEEARALQELRAHAATLAIRTTERLLRERIDGPHAQALLDGAIEQVGRKLS